MRPTLLLPCLLAVLTIASAGTYTHARQDSAPKRSYELTAKSEPVIMGDSTVYTLTENIGGNRREVWRVTSRDRYVRHWVSAKGTVWVLSTRSRIHDSAMLWARDVNADRLGEWNLGSADRATDGKQQKEPLSLGNVDSEKSVARVVGNYGLDQLDLHLKTGGLVRYTVVNQQKQSPITVVRMFPSGEPIRDALSDAVKDSTAELSWPVKDQRTIGIWRFPTHSDPYLLQSFAQPLGDDSTYYVTAERTIPQMPIYVVKTPAARIAWFEFSSVGGPEAALLRLMDLTGREMAVIDLRQLGKFGRGIEAKQSLQYRSISILRNGYPVSLEDVDWYSGQEPEVLQMSDRGGRNYRITIMPGQGRDFTAQAVASLNLEAVPSKEPSLPKSKIAREQVFKSEDGRYWARVRRYEGKDGAVNQMTFLARVQDPMFGPKEMEVWSRPVLSWPAEVRVSNSGRVLELQTGTWSDGKLKGKEFAFLITYEVSGKTMGGLEFITLGWFPSVKDVLSGLDLSKIALSSAGKESTVEQDGIPLTTWSAERFAIIGSDGKARKIRVEGNPVVGLPQMLYYEK